MSHISQVVSEMDDREVLEAACRRLGWTVLEQKTHAWYGRYVGDSQLPAGVKVGELGTCDFAIHVPGAKYEIGVIRTEDGRFALRYDYWHAGGLLPLIGGQDCPKLKQAYGVEKARKHARRLGLRVTREIVRADGKIMLSLS